MIKAVSGVDMTDKSSGCRILTVGDWTCELLGEFIGNKPSVRYAPASEGDWLVRVLQASFAREALDDLPQLSGVSAYGAGLRLLTPVL